MKADTWAARFQQSLHNHHRKTTKKGHSHIDYTSTLEDFVRGQALFDRQIRGFYKKDSKIEVDVELWSVVLSAFAKQALFMELTLCSSGQHTSANRRLRYRCFSP